MVHWSPVMGKSMPELPEVETVRTILEREIVGRTILDTTWGDFPGVTGDEEPEVFRAMTSGRRFSTPERRGKFLLMPLDDDTALMAHLRMTGRLLVTPTDSDPVRFQHLAIHIDGDCDIRFADQRKFGRVLHVETDDARAFLSSLGPEPLSRAFSAEYLAARLRGRSAPIKSFLLDQRHIAGLGNIYVDEALFRSRIHPLTPAGQLSTQQAASLVRSIRKVLRSAIENQGTTFSSFENPYGERGNNVEFLKVYGRARQELPCLRCGTPLSWFKLSGRGTSYCPKCQPTLADRSEITGSNI